MDTLYQTGGTVRCYYGVEWGQTQYRPLPPAQAELDQAPVGCFRLVATVYPISDSLDGGSPNPGSFTEATSQSTSTSNRQLFTSSDFPRRRTRGAKEPSKAHYHNFFLLFFLFGKRSASFSTIYVTSLYSSNLLSRVSYPILVLFSYRQIPSKSFFYPKVCIFFERWLQLGTAQVNSDIMLYFIWKKRQPNSPMRQETHRSDR